MLHRNDTLGDLVTANPARARALEALDLDYCCGGGRTLAEACVEAGRDVDEVVGVLGAVDAASSSPAPTWADLDVADLIEHVVDTHHGYLRNDVPQLLELGRKVRRVHGERHPELEDVVATLERLWAELAPHLDEEEQVQFPRLRTVAAGERGDKLDLSGLRAQHDVAGDLLDHLRRITCDFDTPPDACASFTAFYSGLSVLDADTRLHVHKENNVLFPAVERLAGVPAG